MKVTEETSILKKEIPSIGNLRIIRNDQGVEVFFKSQLIEDYFKKNQRSDQRKEVSTNEGWRGLEFYIGNTPFQQSLQRPKCIVHGLQGGNELYSRDYEGYNFSILRAVGLGNGVKILFTSPTSSERIDEWKRNFVEYLRWIYTNYMRPVDVEVSITVRELEA
jgi:hypothetical protein